MIRAEHIGNATLCLGDCAQVLPAIKTGRPDDCTIVTDPPYEFNNSGGGKFRRSRYGSNAITQAGLDKGFDMRLINKDRASSAVVFCHNDQVSELMDHMRSQYSRVVLLSWHKTNPTPFANRNYQADTEFFIHGWNHGHHPQGDLPDLKRHITTSVQRSQWKHPTIKPLAVMHKIIRNVAGHTIIDPFMGSGSTGIAALAAGKKFIGIERNEQWFNMAVERLRAEATLLQPTTYAEV